jgi:hypothetical protein
LPVSYGQILSGILREECVLGFLENKILRKIFGIKIRKEQGAKENA